MDLIDIEQLELDVKSGEAYLKIKEATFNKKEERLEIFFMLISFSFLLYSFLFIHELQNIFIATIFAFTAISSICLFLCNLYKYSLRILTKNFIKNSDKSIEILKKKELLKELKLKNSKTLKKAA